MPRTLKIEKSTNIKSAVLGDDGLLEITFQNGQSVQYRNVTPAMMDEWEKDKSAGSWFHRNVRSKPDAYPVVPGPGAQTRPPGVPGAPAVDAASIERPIGGPLSVGDGAQIVAEVLADAGKAMEQKPEHDADVLSKDFGKPLEQARPSEVANAMKLAADVVVAEEKCTDAVRVAARAMYESYVTNARGKNYEGKPCPKWEDLTTAIRGHWCAAAITASCEFQPALLKKIEALEAEAKKLKMMLPWRNRGQLGGSRG